ncbi:MAG: hypothetical protein LBG76_03695 [Treponema sp.]|jgi:predicted LPLAT superfamily acyltransferase|nr:hypothetical protein [Treponema sp.]
MNGAEARPLHWSERREAALGYWQLKLLLVLFHLIPVFLMKLLAFPVGFCYWLFAAAARRDSRRFLRRVATQVDATQVDSTQVDSTQAASKGSLSSVRHFQAFSITLIEKIEVWGGKVPFDRIHFQGDDIGELIAALERGEGALLICSHLGNTELLRGLAGFNRTGVRREVPVTSITDLRVNAHFSRMLRELNPGSTLRVINAAEIGPDTIILLQERIARGELVVIAGDRTSEHTRDRCFFFPFLGDPAPFGYGAFLLAALLKAPVYFVFALRRGDLSLTPDYEMHVHKSPLSFNCPRKEREERIRELARSFAARLEEYCKERPYQWYNFFDFWAPPEPGKKERV